MEGADEMGERRLTQPCTKLEKKEERETVGRTRNKEMIDKVFKSLSIL